MTFRLYHAGSITAFDEVIVQDLVVSRLTQTQVQAGERALASGSTAHPRIEESVGSAHASSMHVYLEPDTIEWF
jgi:hypothetical protein